MTASIAGCSIAVIYRLSSTIYTKDTIKEEDNIPILLRSTGGNCIVLFNTDRPCKLNHEADFGHLDTCCLGVCSPSAFCPPSRVLVTKKRPPRCHIGSIDQAVPQLPPWHSIAMSGRHSYHHQLPHGLTQAAAAASAAMAMPFRHEADGRLLPVG